MAYEQPRHSLEAFEKGPKTEIVSSTPWPLSDLLRARKRFSHKLCPVAAPLYKTKKIQGSVHNVADLHTSHFALTISSRFASVGVIHF